MTTAPPSFRPRSGGALVVGAALGAVLVGVVVVILGFTLSGPAAGWGATIGAAMAAGIFLFGTVIVHAIAQVMPAASLIVALLTYTLQLLMLIVAFVVLDRSGLVGHELSAEWLVGGVIGVTLAWTAGQILLFTRARIPVYDAGAR